MIRLLLLLIIVSSCDSRKKVAAPEATQNDYSTLTKENAAEQFIALRSAIKDSSLAIIVDANVAIQAAEFALQATELKPAPLIADSLVLNKTGKTLYKCMRRAYNLCLLHATKAAYIIYYQTQFLIPEGEWLSQQFGGKKNTEG